MISLRARRNAMESSSRCRSVVEHLARASNAPGPFAPKALNTTCNPTTPCATRPEDRYPGSGRRPIWPVLRSAAIPTNPYRLPDIGKPPERRTRCGWGKHEDWRATVHRWAGRILLTLGMVCGVVVGGAPPASAADPPESFFPDGDGAAGFAGNVLSDRFDGVDSRAHLTLVATPEATRAAWYRCPQKADDDNGFPGTIDQEELGLCTKIGEDTVPVVP